MQERTLLEWIEAELYLNRDVAPDLREQIILLRKLSELLICYIENPEPDDERESAAVQLAGLSLYIAETTPEENKEAE